MVPTQLTFNRHVEEGIRGQLKPVDVLMTLLLRVTAAIDTAKRTPTEHDTAGVNGPFHTPTRPDIRHDDSV